VSFSYLVIDYWLLPFGKLKPGSINCLVFEYGLLDSFSGSASASGKDKTSVRMFIISPYCDETSVS